MENKIYLNGSMICYKVNKDAVRVCIKTLTAFIIIYDVLLHLQ